MKLQKTLFILPNLFTLSSVACGFYALLATASARSATDYVAAGLAILLAILFDASDGRVARLTRTQSEFGIQLDSLADVISFGVAPAFLAYQYALQPLGMAGMAVAFLFVAAGACRLARFNVLASRGNGGSGDFVGLPIPLAAGLVAGLVVAHVRSGGGGGTHAAVGLAATTTILSLLMVSTIRYRSFKKVRPTAASLAFLAFLGFVTAGLGLVFRASFVIVALFLAYIAVGIAEEILRVGRAGMVRLRSAVGNAQSAGVVEDEETLPDEGDEDPGDGRP